jgi:hypothetical protein
MSIMIMSTSIITIITMMKSAIATSTTSTVTITIITTPMRFSQVGDVKR